MIEVTIKLTEKEAEIIKNSSIISYQTLTKIQGNLWLQVKEQLQDLCDKCKEKEATVHVTIESSRYNLCEDCKSKLTDHWEKNGIRWAEYPLKSEAYKQSVTDYYDNAADNYNPYPMDSDQSKDWRQGFLSISEAVDDATVGDHDE